MVNKKSIMIFCVIIALSGLAMGLSDTVFSNYFKEVYQVDAVQRGVIEFPREAPGVLSLFVISGLAFIGDIRLSILAQALAAIGLVFLGLFTPSFGIMLVFLFINNMGIHIFMPLADSLGMSLAQKGSVGATMGRFNGIRTAFSMIAGILVFVGFKVGFFSFTTPIKFIFLLSACIFVVVLCLLMYMQRLDTENGKKIKPEKMKLVFRKEYGIFYLIAILFGARKQIMFVYGPWVLIELMGFKTDTMALLSIAGAAIGIFFIPAVGRWIDKYGTARIMMIEASVFILIYICYGFLSAGLSSGAIVLTVVPVVIGFAINMADRMTMQFGMVRAVYMRSIALDPRDVTTTLSLGMAMDHVLSIISAMFCGLLWKELGPQYVFVFAALLSCCNMIAALHIRKGVNPTKAK